MSAPSRTLLLVEDGADERELFLLALEPLGLSDRVELAHDGAEALERLIGGQAGPLPQVVVLDLDLGAISGLEVLERLRREPRTRLLPVVVLTTSNDAASRVACYAAGANGFVHKAVGGVGFAEVVRCIARYWLDVNEAVRGEEG